MFSWPNISRSAGTITVRGRHTSLDTERHAQYGMNGTMCVTMVAVAAWTFAYQKRAGVDTIGAIFLGLMAGFFGGGVAGALLALPLYPFFWLWSRPVTRIRITAASIDVNGVKYNRTAAPVQFTNLFPATTHLEFNGRSAALGALDETTGLRMFYGTNAILVTTFTSAELASRFALACNTALAELATPAVYGVRTVSVAQLYQRGGTPALPVGAVRRRIGHG